MDDIFTQEFLVMICTEADVQPYGLSCTPLLKFTGLPEMGKSGHAERREQGTRFSISS